MYKYILYVTVLLSVFIVQPLSADESANHLLAQKIDTIMAQSAANDNYHVTASELNIWIQEDRKDFVVLDLRFAPDDGLWGQPKYGRIPGSVHIPHYDLFKEEHLTKLPKDKKIILVGHMGVHENYSLVPLRLLGYDAHVLLMGMAGWQKDYPAKGHVTMLIHAPEHTAFPLQKEDEGHQMGHDQKKHMH